ncbi:FAD:protein FMN transferase [Herminiimonas fonticola]|uniref:FAD:protein FMN transferase n=1 Tax=Herminiimonas fonticola TaxID=303380 RepID=A0A4R6GHN7_9BURK|nr:FAD:protein FMN transferase [Herminiimonas fonticola]RBA24637.1 Membrane-associated lipoprotein involved in thiamine biosynthesis [Herminiimonas fonticola]TDN93754.1 thiamine biosynthesis lipoprotein [Herminiimonas fonticola]
MRRTLVPTIDTSPQPPALGSVVHALHGHTMGTTWSVKLVADAARALAPLQSAIQNQLDAVVAQMSTWESDSALSRFNDAPPNSWHTLPTEFFSVLAYALQVARDSDGAYDPTAGALVNAWGFGPTQRYSDAAFIAPSAAQLAIARARCGWQRIQLDVESQRALQPGGVYVDLSAIAKGFGVDQLVHALLQRGIDSFLVEVGGELRGAGIKPDGQPWWIALEHPLSTSSTAANESNIATIAALYNLSVATSGDYRRYFEDGETRFSHTIDPRNGEPISHGLASVTVLHRDCMAADAWSTALGVMGAEQGLAYADRHDLAALFIQRGNQGFEEHMSKSMAALLQ